MRRLMIAICLLNAITRGIILADQSQRSFFDDSEALLVRRERQTNTTFVNNSTVNFAGGFNSFFPALLQLFLGGFVSQGPFNASISNATQFSLTTDFFTTLFAILQYATFVAFFVMFMGFMVFGVFFLYMFNYMVPSQASPFSTTFTSNSLFRSFEDENMPLFDKITSVGYGLLDRGSELYGLIQTPECRRYAMCHLSSSFGDQEANGFVFKDLLRSISSTLDNKGATEGMTRAVNVGLLTGECDEPIMNCPELVPYFKKVVDTVSNYI
ncbi:hypothetical protein RvY_06328 [Ramazzottius varieornatus]|uniref:Uncharacterized protein n=1 Tax=Ramazzottius varieornatus TaxID=947166 RepID=A0A1D1UY46_RAMVA|nr:hypothetical protein RvY_06328 [Ramazzottius varieornatus]